MWIRWPGRRTMGVSILGYLGLLGTGAGQAGCGGVGAPLERTASSSSRGSGGSTTVSKLAPGCHPTVVQDNADVHVLAGPAATCRTVLVASLTNYCLTTCLTANRSCAVRAGSQSGVLVVQEDLRKVARGLPPSIPSEVPRRERYLRCCYSSNFFFWGGLGWAHDRFGVAGLPDAV